MASQRSSRRYDYDDVQKNMTIDISHSKNCIKEETFYFKDINVPSHSKASAGWNEADRSSL